MTMMARLRTWAQAIKRDTYAVYLVGRDPRVPWYAKLLAAAVAAYALSPIDIIPDFIPVLGYLDDLILLPLGLLLIVRLIPHGVMEDCRARAETMSHRPVSRSAVVVVVGIWVAVAGVLIWLAYPYFE